MLATLKGGPYDGQELEVPDLVQEVIAGGGIDSDDALCYWRVGESPVFLFTGKRQWPGRARSDRPSGYRTAT